MKLLAAGRSMIVGAVLGARRTEAHRLRPLDLGTAVGAVDEHVARGLRLPDDLSAHGLRDAFGRGDTTSELVVLGLLDRIRRRDPELCSLIELDPTAVLAARAADARRREGRSLGPLDGVPVTVKDNIETAAPVRTTAGAAVLADHVAAADAPVVARLRAAGAVVLATANLSELAGAVARTAGVSAVGGRTRNPYGDSFSPGGSSSGSAVSVAAGLTSVSVGTETSGSLLAPSACNGVVGMKPSLGVVPTDGIVPLVSSQDSAGPVATCVADAAVVLSVLSDGAIDPAALSADGLAGVTAGVLRDDILGQRSPLEDTADNPDVLERIVDGLRAAGATCRDVALDGAAAVEKGFGSFVLSGLAIDTVGYLAGAGTPVRTIADLHAFNLRQPSARMPKGQLLVTMAMMMSSADPARYAETATRLRAAAAAVLDGAFAGAVEGGAVDVLVSISNRHSALYATAGYPAITVPVGLRRNGMPTGVTLIGRQGDDETLLSRAFAFEQATSLRVPPPR